MDAPEAAQLLRDAEIALDEGDTARGQALIEKARVVDPASGGIRFLEGRMLFEDGDTSRAIEAYGEAVRAAPSLGEAHGGRVRELWTMSFPAWAAATKAQCRTIAAAGEATLPRPDVIPAAEAHYWPAGVERVPEIFIGRIEDAEVLPPECAVLASDGCLFLQGFVTSPTVYGRKIPMVKYASRDGRLLLDLPRAALKVEMPCLLLGRSNSYFHFLLETLPRIHSAEVLGLGAEVPALVPDDLYATELELLALLGFPRERLIRVPKGVPARCRTLYAPSIYGEGYVVSPLAVQFVRERVRARVPEVPDLPRRVYLSRNRMPRRHVVNESELLPRLERHGFETVYPETLGVAEQVRLFSQAEAIVSPDSSALANLAFAAPGAKVAILSWRGLHKPLWHCIAVHAGTHVTYIHVDGVLESSAAIAHRDMRIDPSYIDAWLQTL